MRLLQYINEAATLINTAEEIVERIKSECQPFLKEVQGRRAYRGIQKSNPAANYMKKEVRTDRQPLTSTRDQHDFIDGELYKKFGWHPRSEAMFVFGAPTNFQLSVYGSIFMVFPIGQYKYVWSPDIRDLYQDLPVDRKSYMQQWAERMIPTYKDTGLKTALTMKDYEVMIGCKEYYAVRLLPDEPYKTKDMPVLKELLKI